MTPNKTSVSKSRDFYQRLSADISGLLEQARLSAARSMNAILDSRYWRIGKRIVEHEQGCEARPGYGEELLKAEAHQIGWFLVPHRFAVVSSRITMPCCG
jgi:hypothetical protein